MLVVSCYIMSPKPTSIFSDSLANLSRFEEYILVYIPVYLEMKQHFLPSFLMQRGWPSL